MFKKNGFTLIELIVVIAVLGILAAIIVPNISSFQTQARDVQLDADAKNIQTAVDMFRMKSASGVGEPVLALTGATKGNVQYTAEGKTFNAVDMTLLTPTYLRKTPKYVINSVFDPAGAVDQTAKITQALVDKSKGQVVVGIQLDGTGNTTSIVSYATNDGTAVKISR